MRQVRDIRPFIFRHNVSVTKSGSRPKQGVLAFRSMEATEILLSNIFCMNGTLRIAGIVEESIVDGPGLRYVIFTQGCARHCPGCHNPETQPFEGGRLVSLDWILQDVQKNPITRGVTFSGGEPFAQSEELTVLGRELKQRGYNLTAFSGFTFEELAADGRFRPLLELLDILVDGPFVLAERSLLLRFRGSRNQRVLDVPKSLSAGRAVLHPLHN